MTARRVLLVDDDANLRKVLADLLGRAGCAVTAAGSAAEALAAAERDPFDVVLSDLRLGGPTGLDLIRDLRARGDDVPVVIMTAYGSIPVAVEAVRRGAADFVTKPIEVAEIVAAIEKAARSPAPAEEEPALLGDDPKMADVRAKIAKVAGADVPVLITGETGTGKDVAAQLLHRQGRRAAKPFVRVLCSALPEALVESELFGHEAGAFTGAAAAKPGRFELAHGGTIFLDEVGELPAAAQAKLLAAVERREIERVGGVHPVAVDVRIVAATNRDLAAGGFRPDLYHRLRGVEIRMPALRERPGDIVPLFEAYLARAAKRAERRAPAPATDAKDRLRAHAWPGNVRELVHAAERVVLLHERPELNAPELGGFLEETPADATLRAARSKAEGDRIRQILGEVGGNRTHAAKRLGISRRGLLYKLKELGIE